VALKIPADIEDALLHVFAPGPASGCATPGTISCVWGSDQNRSTGATLQDSTGPGFKAALDRCPRGTDGSNPANLTLLPNGDLRCRASAQPADSIEQHQDAWGALAPPMPTCPGFAREQQLGSVR